MSSSFGSLVLVTGGAGFIGSHLVDRLLADGLRVRVIDNLINGSVDRLSGALGNKNFEFIQGDIRSVDSCRKAVRGCDFVFHLACLGVRHSIHSPFENHQVNAEGTLNMLLASREQGIRHFFYISTSEVYGRTPDFPITENSLTKPLTVYGSSKLAGENYALSFFECYSLPVTILRIFNNYGPRSHYEGDAGEIIPRSIVKILYKKSPSIFGDGKVTRDFFYVKDTANVLTGLLWRCASLSGQIINIGSGIETSMLELVRMLQELMDYSDSDIIFFPDRPADVPRLWVDNRLMVSLGIALPENKLKANLLETIEYFQTLAHQKNLLEGLVEKNWE